MVLHQHAQMMAFFFGWTKVHFVGPLIAPVFGLRVTLPMGFKARVVLSPAHLLTCLR